MLPDAGPSKGKHVQSIPRQTYHLCIKVKRKRKISVSVQKKKREKDINGLHRLVSLKKKTTPA
jgi:hypothetical protein